MSTVRKLTRIGPLRTAVKIPRALWGRYVAEIEAKTFGLPGWACNGLYVGPDRVLIVMEQA